MTAQDVLLWVAIALVTIASTARITRLVTIDAFPPAAWLRSKLDDLTNENEWSLLWHCPYCFSFWTMIVITAWGYFSGWDTAWWLTNSIFGGSYLAAILVTFDGED